MTPDGENSTTVDNSEAMAAKPRRGFALMIAPLVAFALMGLFGWGLFFSSRDLPSPLIDKPVPEFVLAPVQGQADGLATADLRGQVSLVNFFASWCVPCRAEHPLFMELAQSGEVKLYGINYKDLPDEAEAWLEELGNPYTRVGADPNGRVAIDWGVYGIPETFVVAADGTIAYKVIGQLTRPILENQVMPVVRRLNAENSGSMTQ